MFDAPFGSRRRPFQIASVIDSAAGANVRVQAAATIHGAAMKVDSGSIAVARSPLSRMGGIGAGPSPAVQVGNFAALEAATDGTPSERKWADEAGGKVREGPRAGLGA